MIHKGESCYAIPLFYLKYFYNIYKKTPQNRSPEESKILFEIVRSENV